MSAVDKIRLIFDLTTHIRQTADRKENQSVRLIFDEIYGVNA
jgi:hypothetical protein